MPPPQEPHQTVSRFVPASGGGDEALAERRRFALDADRWAAFMAALDAAPRSLPRLKRLFRETSPFDTP